MSNELWHAKKSNNRPVQGPVIDYKKEIDIATSNGETGKVLKIGKKFCDTLIAESGTKNGKATKSSKKAHPLSVTATNNIVYKKGTKNNFAKTSKALKNASKKYSKLSPKAKKEADISTMVRGTTKSINSKRIKK